MWQPQYVTAQQRAGFRRYQYSAVDTNPLSVYVMQPLWNRIVKRTWECTAKMGDPKRRGCRITACRITYYSVGVESFGRLLQCCLDAELPHCVSIQKDNMSIIDSIDGKHARRTKSSSPLGELFDHGLDSWATSIFILSYFSICSRDNGKTGISVHTMYISLSIVLLNFMFSHWEKYNTGVLFLPWGYDLSQVTLIAMYLVTAAVGVEVWHKPFLFGYYITDILVILLIGCSIFLSLPQTLYNIHK
ncbi:V-type proton ATPase subunit d 2 [Platysternon megacephalum]|uniref:V-type proton ATPase subunit d 2 n=1 Tax=Platysternon megacephalum TaxID=55544 RepID=A0A4D9EM54_9SAUR|nr:V-type proton ATPase subunit d 2 [Platysternon megacephalum]